MMVTYISTICMSLNVGNCTHDVTAIEVHFLLVRNVSREHAVKSTETKHLARQIKIPLVRIQQTSLLMLNKDH